MALACVWEPVLRSAGYGGVRNPHGQKRRTRRRLCSRPEAASSGRRAPGRPGGPWGLRGRSRASSRSRGRSGAGFSCRRQHGRRNLVTQRLFWAAPQTQVEVWVGRVGSEEAMVLGSRSRAGAQGQSGTAGGAMTGGGRRGAPRHGALGCYVSLPRHLWNYMAKQPHWPSKGHLA